MSGDRTNTRTSRRIKKKQDNYKLALKIIIIILLLIFLVSSSIIYMKYHKLTSVTPETYYDVTDWSNWEGVDYEIKDHRLLLKRYKYYAPYAMTRILPENSPQEIAVIKVSVAVTKFTDSSYTILTAYTPSGSLSLITDTTGRVGITRSPDEFPEYSRDRVITSKKHDLHFVINTPESIASIYVDGTHAITADWDGYLYPLQEIWLGSFWVGGQTGYGAPLDVTVEGLTVGDENLLFQDYSIYQFLKDNPLYLFIPLILLILICITCYLLDRSRKKDLANKLIVDNSLDQESDHEIKD